MLKPSTKRNCKEMHRLGYGAPFMGWDVEKLGEGVLNMIKEVWE